MIFKERFKEILKENNLKQQEIAKLCNIDKSCITQYKNGKTQPTLEVLYKLCKVLNVSSDYLLGLEDDFGNKSYLNEDIHNSKDINNNTFNNSFIGQINKSSINFKK